MRRAYVAVILVAVIVALQGCTLRTSERDSYSGSGSTEKKQKVNLRDCRAELRDRSVVFTFWITNDLLAPADYIRVSAEILWEQPGDRAIQRDRKDYNNIPVGGAEYVIEIPLHSHADPSRFTLLVANLSSEIAGRWSTVLIDQASQPSNEECGIILQISTPNNYVQLNHLATNPGSVEAYRITQPYLRYWVGETETEILLNGSWRTGHTPVGSDAAVVIRVPSWSAAFNYHISLEGVNLASVTRMVAGLRDPDFLPEWVTEEFPSAELLGIECEKTLIPAR